jgi:threonylcarbamoyladenosine tRNA methylthiotransferase MtaB
MPTLKTLTLGCKVNQYETQFVRDALARLGYHDSAPDRPADLCIVNTCTVTAEADRKSRKLIRQLARENPGAQIVVMGCYATRKPDEAAALPGVTEILTDKLRLGQWLAARGAVPLPTGITSFADRHRAYVKIQDGCQMGCAYCVIPQTRPVLSSRPIPEVLAEILGLVDRGYREIVLTGIHLGHYGAELAPAVPQASCARVPRASCPCQQPAAEASRVETNLTNLLRHIVRLDGFFRVRISSIEAAEVPDELIDLIAEHPTRLCPHLHLSMQSGSDPVLRRMRRRWTSGEFLDRCRAIQERLDRPGLTTDVIVGFPGETETDFDATCHAVALVGFSKIHVFRFSPRPGTPASKMTDTVPSDTQRRRAARLAEIEKRLRAAYFASLVDRDLTVLVESAAVDPTQTLLGTSAEYAPAQFPGPPNLLGQLVRVQAQSSTAEGIQAGIPQPVG